MAKRRVARKVLTLAEAVKFLRISQAKLRNAAEAGRIPGRKIERSWRFFKPWLVQWWENHPMWCKPSSEDCK
jgi:Helix-turn-helix domain